MPSVASFFAGQRARQRLIGQHHTCSTDLQITPEVRRKLLGHQYTSHAGLISGSVEESIAQRKAKNRTHKKDSATSKALFNLIAGVVGKGAARRFNVTE